MADTDNRFKAFLLGCNSGELKHCGTDGDLGWMGKALERYGYDSTVVDTSLQESTATANSQDDDGDDIGIFGFVTNKLLKLLQRCGSNDTLIFYFSGHSRNHEQFYLILADPLTDEENRIEFDWILSRLENRIKKRKLADVLIILDCCESGQGVLDWTPPTKDWLRIYTATSSRGQAVQMDEIKASFFTHCLYRALTENFAKVTRNGTINLNDLDDWVQLETKRYNEERERLEKKRIPIPVAYGNPHKNIALTPEYRILPPLYIRRLKDLGAQIEPKPEMLRSCFRQCYQRIETVKELSCPDEIDMWSCMIDYWLDIGKLETAEMPVPLLSFVNLVAAQIVNGQKLKDWLKQALAELDLSADRVNLEIQTGTEQQAEEKPPVVMVEFAPNDANAKYYTVQTWLQDRQGNISLPLVWDTSFTIDKLPQLMDEVYFDGKIQALCEDEYACHPLSFEFFLPKYLMDADLTLEEWQPGPPPDEDEPPNPPLGHEHCVALRCWERQRTGKWREKWALHWNKPKVFEKTAYDSAVWLDKADMCYSEYLNDNRLLILLRCKPPRTELIAMFQAGAAMIIWPRETLEPSVEEKLQEQLPKHSLCDVPQSVYKARCSLWGASKRTHIGNIHLLWDDRHRGLPAIDETEQPLLDPNHDLL